MDKRIVIPKLRELSVKVCDYCKMVERCKSVHIKECRLQVLINEVYEEVLK